MAYSRNRLKIRRNAKARTVTLFVEKRDAYFRLVGKSQVTFTERELERALLDAEIIAPWNRVPR